MHFFEIPSDHDIAIGLVPLQAIAQKAQGGWNRTVVARIVAVMHVHEDPASGRNEAGELTENLPVASRGKDVSEDIPETRDHVKFFLHRVKLLGAYGLEVGFPALHPNTGLNQNEFRYVSGLRDLASSDSIARPDIQHGAASRRNLGNHQPIDAVEIPFALFSGAREHRPNLIVRGDRI
jgi:hypothetical protein